MPNEEIINVNKVILVGILEKDANVGTTAGGKPVGNLSVITDESYTNNDGVKIEKTEKHKIVAWGKQAEYCRNLKKGRNVYIEGKNQTRKTDDGFVNEVVATSIQ
jgi:single-strand DNA-binding protein